MAARVAIAPTFTAYATSIAGRTNLRPTSLANSILRPTPGWWRSNWAPNRTSAEVAIDVFAEKYRAKYGQYVKVDAEGFLRHKMIGKSEHRRE